MINCLKDPAYVLMRVLPCKIHCPSFICFCKPTPHIYAAAAAGPLKLENTSSTTVASANGDENDDARVDVDVDHVDGHGDEVKEENTVDVDGQEGERQVVGGGDCLKSSLRKADSNSTDADTRKKKKVQWVDSMGKQLAEIKEFEPSEVEDIGYDGGRSCVCVIL